MRMPLDEHVCLHYCQVAGFDLTLIARFRAAAWQIFRVTNFVYSEIRKKTPLFSSYELNFAFVTLGLG